MKYITLINGIKLPLNGFGTAGLKDEVAYEAVKNAIKVGYRLIDTADMYGNEIFVGKAIKDSDIDREELFIVSKVDSRNNSYEKTKKQIDKSLRDLQLSYLDLYLIHEPYEEGLQMWKAIEEAYEAGKIRAIGISNYFERRFSEFYQNVRIKPMVNQLEIHPFLQRKEFVHFLQKEGVAVIAWSPLAQGKNDIFNNSILKNIAVNHNKTVSQIILKYLIDNDVVVIPKSANVHHMIENLDLFSFELSKDEKMEIEKLNNNQTIFEWTRSFL